MTDRQTDRQSDRLTNCHQSRWPVTHLDRHQNAACKHAGQQDNCWHHTAAFVLPLYTNTHARTHTQPHTHTHTQNTHTRVPAILW